MKIKLVKTEGMEDWYTIERQEHGHKRSWVEYSSNGSFLYDSARISDACVEGSAQEMRELAQAILDKSSYSAKRCAVKVDVEDEVALFWSPRNSQMRGEVRLHYAEEFATEALATLKDLK